MAPEDGFPQRLRRHRTIRLCPQKAPSHHCLRLDQWAHQSQSTMSVMIWFPDHSWPAAMDCEQEKRYSAEHKKEQNGTAAWNTNQSWNLDVIKWHPSATKTTYTWIYIYIYVCKYFYIWQMPGLCPEPQRGRATHHHHHHHHHHYHHHHHHHHHQLNVDFNIL